GVVLSRVDEGVLVVPGARTLLLLEGSMQAKRRCGGRCLGPPPNWVCKERGTQAHRARPRRRRRPDREHVRCTLSLIAPSVRCTTTTSPVSASLTLKSPSSRLARCFSKRLSSLANALAATRHSSRS